MILGIIEHDRGNLNDVSLEMLTLARDLGQPLEAVIVGETGRPLAERLPAFGASSVHLILHERLGDNAPEAEARSIVQLMTSLSPEAIIAPGTDRGHEVLAHVAAITDLPMAANCTAVQPGEVYTVTRQRWGGSLLEEARLQGSPKLLTVAAHSIAAAEEPAAAALTVQTFTPDLSDKDFRVRVTERIETAGDKISLGEARLVVGGGRGVGSTEGFQILEELAGLLDGAVGGSRVVTNLGWRPHADQIGQTGTRISPDLYIACGISGAVQHMVGAKGSKHVLAVNKDAEAPIVAKSDYAIIGDLHEVVPALIAEIRNERGL